SISSIKPDLQGNVYISDSLSHVVRRIDQAGTIVTVAGTGLSRPSSLAIDAGGNVFIADTTNNLVYQLSPDGRLSHFAGTGNPGSDFNLSGGEQATQVSFTPVQIASDSKGGLFILDARSVVLRVDANNIISRIAGGGFTPDGQPIGASVQGVLSRLSHGQLIRIAGASSAGFGGDGGPGTEAKLDSPGDLATDSEGSLFVVDVGNRRVRKLSPSGIIST